MARWVVLVPVTVRMSFEITAGTEAKAREKAWAMVDDGGYGPIGKIDRSELGAWDYEEYWEVRKTAGA